MNYKVDPGLYALGCPDDKSPVLISANYKLSFDTLRSALKGRHLWILVLDTDGVNVWCAAGKGTFSTAELVRRIEFSRLEEVVSHRRLIVPQLAAPGVAAHEVKKLSGFKVTYGPIRAADLPAFIDCGIQGDLGDAPEDIFHMGKAGIGSGRVGRSAEDGNHRRAYLCLFGGTGRIERLLGQPDESWSLCCCGFVERSFSRDSPRSNPFALAARTCICLEGNDPRSFSGIGSGIRLECRFDARIHNPGESGVASHSFCFIRLFCHELHRSLHLYIPFRGQERDAMGSPPANSGCCRGTGTLVLVTLYCVRYIEQ